MTSVLLICLHSYVTKCLDQLQDTLFRFCGYKNFIYAISFDKRFDVLDNITYVWLNMVSSWTFDCVVCSAYQNTNSIVGKMLLNEILRKFYEVFSRSDVLVNQVGIGLVSLY